MAESLFGHLVFRFSSSPENLATEALNFVLNRSHVSRDAFINLFSDLNISLPLDLKFETQEVDSEDCAIPDLVGKDSSAKPVILGESKFWAGLTENQPVRYLTNLLRDNGKLLVFFAPAKRFPTLWPELIRLSKNGGINFEKISEFPEINIAKIDRKSSSCPG